MATLGLLAGIFAVLGILAMLGGADSRDGEDWVRHGGQTRAAV